jgi:proteasome lid subunit RPN8/RPN11
MLAERNMKKTKFILPYDERRMLHQRAYRAQQKDQSEVCGVVLVGADQRLRLHFLRNQSSESWSFEISNVDIKDAREKAGLNGERLIGLFHSHIASEAIPSSGDLAKTPMRYLQLIYDICGRNVRMWRVKKVNGEKVTFEVAIDVEPRLKQQPGRWSGEPSSPPTTLGGEILDGYPWI